MWFSLLTSDYHLSGYGGDCDTTMLFPGGEYGFTGEVGIFHFHIGMAHYGVYVKTGSRLSKN